MDGGAARIFADGSQNKKGEKIMYSKRLTVAVLSLSCLFSTFCGSAARAADTSAEYLLEADFDSIIPEYTESVSVVPGKFEIKSSGEQKYENVLSLSKGDGENNSREGKVAATFDLGTNAIKRNSGKYQIEFDVRTDQTDQWAPYIIMAGNGFAMSCIGADTSEVICSYAATRTNGWWAIYEKNVENKVTLSPKQWMNVKIVLDTATGISEYYYNNTYVGSPTDSGMKSLVRGGIRQLELQVWSHEGYDPEIYFDNLRVKKLRPEVAQLTFESVSGETAEMSREVNVLSDTIRAKIENLSSESELEGMSLTADGEEVAFSYGYDSESGVCTIRTETYFEIGKEYVLHILDKEYVFTITDYPSEFKVSEISAYKGDKKISDVSGIAAGDTLTAAVDVINTTGESKNVCLAVACYDGGKLKSVKYKNVATASDSLISRGTADIAIPEHTNLGIRIFAFDNPGSFMPLADCIEMGTLEDSSEGTVFDMSGESAGRTAAYVFAPGKSAADMAEDIDVSNILVYLSQQTSGENGKWQYSVKLDETYDSGLYKGYVSCENGTAEFRLSHLNVNENEAAITALKTSASFVNDAKDNSAALGFGQYTDDVPDKAYEILEDYFKNNDVDAAALEKNLNTVRRCELLALINQGSKDNIFDYSETLKDDMSDIEKYFTKNYFDVSMQKKITAKLKEKSVSSLSALKTAINECFVLSCVESPNGYKNLTEVLSDFADEIGVSAISINDTVSSRIAGKTYSSYSALKTAITGGIVSGGGSGGGTGGGSPANSTESSKTSGSVSAIGGINKNDTPAPVIPKNIYKDIDSDFWACDAIVAVTEKGIVNGRDNSMFCPNDYVTREEFVKMIVLAFVEEQSAEDAAFGDVEKNAWYYNYVACAAAMGIVGGYEDKTFGVGRRITREEMSVIMNRTAQLCKYNLQTPDVIEKFDDDSEISEYARDAVYTLKNAEIVNGDNNRFNPKANATRAEAVTIIYNLLSQ